MFNRPGGSPCGGRLRAPAARPYVPIRSSRPAPSFDSPQGDAGRKGGGYTGYCRPGGSAGGMIFISGSGSGEASGTFSSTSCCAAAAAGEVSVQLTTQMS